MKCCEYDSWECIHNTSFSSWLTNWPYKLECCATQDWNSLPGQTLQSIGLICKLQRKSIVVNMTPGTVFATLHFLLDLQMGPITYSVALHKTGKACRDKHSRVLGSFVSYKENDVLWIWLLARIRNTSFSSWLTNGTYKLECCITQDWKSLQGQTEYYAHSEVTKKTKCCEYDSWDCIRNTSFCLQLMNRPIKLECLSLVNHFNLY